MRVEEQHERVVDDALAARVAVRDPHAVEEDGDQDAGEQLADQQWLAQRYQEAGLGFFAVVAIFRFRSFKEVINAGRQARAAEAQPRP